MTSIINHQSNQTTKLLLLGDTGSGKTGSLASLASAGYNLRILDLDNGLDVLKNVLLDSRSIYDRTSAERVHFETITDPMRNIGGKLVPKQATVWQRAIKLLDNWSTGEDKFGPISSWTTQDVLVIDSLTLLCNAALNFVLSMNARLGQTAHQSDWYTAQQMVESLLQMLYDEGIKCNVVMLCHVVYLGEENGPLHGHPASLGKALSPKIGRYFNSMLMAKTQGYGSNQKRLILTGSTSLVELKNTAPLSVKPNYPLETGLADYFAAVRNANARTPDAPVESNGAA